MSTRLWKKASISSAYSCLNLEKKEASGTVLSPQKSLNSLEKFKKSRYSA